METKLSETYQDIKIFDCFQGRVLKTMLFYTKIWMPDCKMYILLLFYDVITVDYCKMHYVI